MQDIMSYNRTCIPQTNSNKQSYSNAINQSLKARYV